MNDVKRLVSLIKNPRQMDARALQYMRQVVSHHPYFALAHVLVAKGTYLLREEDAREKIGIASLYTVDRARLRRIILEDSSSSPDTVRDVSVSLAPAPPQKSAPPPKAVPAPSAPAAPSLPLEEMKSTASDALAHDRLVSDVYENLERLNRSKSAYLAKEAALYSEELRDTISRVKDSLKEEYAPEVEVRGGYFSAPRGGLDEITGDDRRQIEEALERHGTQARAARFLGISPRLLAKKMKEYGIPATKRERERFSQPEEPSLGEQEDLSMISQRLEEAIPSERLADLYIKQGKFENAIEVYEKMASLYQDRREDIEDKLKKLRDQSDR